MGQAETKFDEGAKELLVLVAKIEIEAELEKKLAGTRWRLVDGRQAVDFVTQEGDDLLAVTVDTGSQVTVTSWWIGAGWTKPARLDQRDSSWSVFPKYEAANNVFDRQRLIDRESRLTLLEVNFLLWELIAILRSN